MTDLGAVVLDLAASSRREFVMCSPFAKVGVVARVLSAIPDGVKISLFTRWRPDEVAAGVSDTEVLPAVRARGGIVCLHDRLHAKYYRNEWSALVGSANLTATALGWVASPNLELLTDVNLDVVERLERRLTLESVSATDDIARDVEEIAALLPRRTVDPLCVEGMPEPPSEWVPRLRMPADLFLVYSDGSEVLTSTSAEAAAGDLEALELPAGLERRQFESLVAHRLLMQPFFKRLDGFLTRQRRFGEVRDMISLALEADREEAEVIWQTAMRWMFEFLPERYSYEVHRHTELVCLTSEGER